ncbi:MAG: thiamine phosphate synthase [Clostridium sp.]|uniref:thiamine phosphate synthase n=1 Tax=Clostridium sp. TaxID=1506 RepID=UPI00304EAD03
MIYLITNRHLANEEKYLRTLREASLAGVERIILREKDLSNEQLEELYYKVKEVINPATEIIINSNIEILKKVGEKILQLPFKSFMEFHNEKNWEIGVAVHSIEEGIAACEKGCSYILASHIFPTKCKDGLAPKGIEFIKELSEKVTCNIIALGGISTENAQSVIEAGADGVAVMSAFFMCEDVGELVQGLIGK